MTWLVFGSVVNITLNGSSSRIWGNGTQQAMLCNSGKLRPQTIPALWSISCNTAPGIDIDAAGDGLLQRAKDRPDLTHFMIRYWSKDDSQPEAVGFSICLPPNIFEYQEKFWRDALFRPNAASYAIIMDFVGFRVPDATTETPTIDEWMGTGSVRRKPAFGTDVTVRFEQNTDKAKR